MEKMASLATIPHYVFWAFDALSTAVIALARYSKTVEEAPAVQTHPIHLYTALRLRDYCKEAEVR